MSKFERDSEDGSSVRLSFQLLIVILYRKGLDEQLLQDEGEGRGSDGSLVI